MPCGYDRRRFHPTTAHKNFVIRPAAAPSGHITDAGVERRCSIALFTRVKRSPAPAWPYPSVSRRSHASVSSRSRPSSVSRGDAPANFYLEMAFKDRLGHRPTGVGASFSVSCPSKYGISARRQTEQRPARYRRATANKGLFAASWPESLDPPGIVCAAFWPPENTEIVLSS